MINYLKLTTKKQKYKPQRYLFYACKIYSKFENQLMSSSITLKEAQIKFI